MEGKRARPSLCAHGEGTEGDDFGLADIRQVCWHQDGINGMDQAIAGRNIGLHYGRIIDANAIAAVDGDRMSFQSWAGDHCTHQA